MIAFNVDDVKMGDGPSTGRFRTDLPMINMFATGPREKDDDDAEVIGEDIEPDLETLAVIAILDFVHGVEL